MKRGQHGEVPAQPKRRSRTCADVFEPVQTAGLWIVGLDLRADDDVEIAIAIDVAERGDRLGAQIDVIEQMRRRDGPDAGRRLVELIQICGAGLDRIERPTEHADDKVRAAVAVQVTGGGRVVAARLERRLQRKRNPIAVKVRMRARALIPDPQEARLEEVAPQDVGVPVAIDVEDSHRIGAMQ